MEISRALQAELQKRDELPYNDMGKLLRRVLKAELADLGDVEG